MPILSIYHFICFKNVIQSQIYYENKYFKCSKQQHCDNISQVL